MLFAFAGNSAASEYVLIFEGRTPVFCDVCCEQIGGEQSRAMCSQGHFFHDGGKKRKCCNDGDVPVWQNERDEKCPVEECTGCVELSPGEKAKRKREESSASSNDSIKESSDDDGNPEKKSCSEPSK